MFATRITEFATCICTLTWWEHSHGTTLFNILSHYNAKTRDNIIHIIPSSVQFEPRLFVSFASRPRAIIRAMQVLPFCRMSLFSTINCLRVHHVLVLPFCSFSLFPILKDLFRANVKRVLDKRYTLPLRKHTQLISISCQLLFITKIKQQIMVKMNLM